MRETISREWHRMTARRLYLGVCIVLPLFCLFFMATIFGNGQMENIPIGIVDQDNSASSRMIARNIAAVPTFRVAQTYTDEAAARKAVQQKEIYGYLSIPPRFEQDATTGKRATLNYYYHYALLSVGGELMAAFETALAPVALSPIALQAIELGVNQEQVENFLLPIQMSNHPIYNPSLDYSVYLSLPFFYILLQVLILLTTVYVVGTEIKFGTAGDWLASAQGNIVAAVAGKLLPYTIIYIGIGWLANYVMLGILHIPFEGSWWLLSSMTVLFIIATQALGLFLFSLYPVVAIVISVVSMVGSLGATLSGVTFPVMNMYPLVRDASYLFPVRHFTEAIQTMFYYDGGLVVAWSSGATLCLFPLLALALLPRLRRAIVSSGSSERESPDVDTDTQPTQHISAIIIREFRAIATNYAVLLVLVGGIFVYGLLYNYIYAPNIVTNAPIAVVDHSHSSLSRQYIRWLNATPQVAVAVRTPNYLEARRQMQQGEVQGILYLPHDFETRVMRGEESAFVMYGTTDAFLYFEALQKATAGTMLALNDAYRKEVTVFLPPQGVIAVTMAKPINVSGTALYNVTEGYGSYLIPAVMMVILFQTMLMVIAMLNPTISRGSASPEGRFRQTTEGMGWGMALRVVLGKTFVYCALYAIFALFLLGLLPHFFSIPNIGNGVDIALMMIPYLLATSFFSLAASRYFTDSEAPLLMIAFFSVGLIFLSGVSYPLELMPWYWQAAHYLVPAAPGTLAFVKLNSMGASLADIRVEYITLWAQVAVYFLISVTHIRASYRHVCPRR